MVDDIPGEDIILSVLPVDELINPRPEGIESAFGVIPALQVGAEKMDQPAIAPR